MKLSAHGTTFLGQETAHPVDDALIANAYAWKLFGEAVRQAMDASTPGRYVALNEDIREALSRASLADRKVYQLVRLDVSWPEYDRRYRRTRCATPPAPPDP
jgi:hypothetical protein